jgi:hypothetical protein
MSIPTCLEIGSSLEGTARAVARIVVAIYVAGVTVRIWVEGIASFTERLTHEPLDAVLSIIPTVKSDPEILAMLGAVQLDEEALEAEIEIYDARRKSAKASKVAVAT